LTRRGQLAVIVTTLLMSCSAGADPQAAEQAASEEPTRLGLEVLETYPHDPQAYTQGLLWHQGELYESTGHYGQSTLRRVDPETGEILDSVELSADFFGEGLARIEDRLVQLTWREGTALVWDLRSLEEVRRIPYEGEGWGLCYDGRHLVMSDGSGTLEFRDPATLQVQREVEVTLRDGVVGRLNELECARGWIYANVYTTDWIVRIDPQSGRVAALIDASGLLSAEQARDVEVLNGIAYDPGRQVFYLTGKLWPKLFAVRFVGPAGD